MEKDIPHLQFFYGDTCRFTAKVKPQVECLEKKLGGSITKLEVWRDSSNAKVLEDIDKGFCGGVPFFWNAKSQKYVCGSTSCEKLIKWAED